MEPTTQKGHPKGLYLLYFTEMWERFSYYGMRAIFTLYMVNALLFDKSFASQIYGSYTGLVYLTPLIGGFIADKYWGNRRSIIVGGLLMAIGQFFMFASGAIYATPETAKLVMFTGLGFLIVGNGFFKPNISTMVGQLYKPGDSRVDSAFTIFYQGINLGAMLAPFICGGLGEKYDPAGNIIPSAFKYGFLAACIGMIISLIAFILLKNKYLVTPEGHAVGVPPKLAYNRQEEVKATEKSGKMGMGRLLGGLIAVIALYYFFSNVLAVDVIGSLIFSSCIVFSVLIVMDPSLSKIERDRIIVIYIIAFFVIFFWSAFEQAGASLTFFAQEQTDRTIFGWNMPASFFQVFNAAFIVILAPVAVSIWSWLNARKKEPSSPVKQALGLALLAVGYLYIAWGVHGVQPWTKVSMIWLIGLYFIHTVGELCLSPIGLSMVVKLSPVRLTSLLMGVWFMSNAVSNKFAGTLSALYPEEVKIASIAGAKPDVMAQLKNSSFDTTGVWNLTADKYTAIETAKVMQTKDSITSITPSGVKKDISVYHLKLMRAVNSKFNKALISEDGKTLYSYRVEEQKTPKGVKTAEKIDVWDLAPKKPSFMGMTINNLYDFFMLFVYMAGIASIILFLLSKRLLKMMHGLR